MKQVIVFYDQACPMCIGVTGWLYRIDQKKQFKLVPYQDEHYLKQYPQLDARKLEKQIHVITTNGTVLRGADAMMEIWRMTEHPTRFLAYIFRIPPFIWIARPVYNLIAYFRKDLYPNRF